MFQSPIVEQVLFVAQFLSRKLEIVSQRNPISKNFAQLARFYNGSGYAKHHYDESLARWSVSFNRYNVERPPMASFRHGVGRNLSFLFLVRYLPKTAGMAVGGNV